MKKRSTHSSKENKAIIRTDYSIEELNKSSKNQDIKFTNLINL